MMTQTLGAHLFDFLLTIVVDINCHNLSQRRRRRLSRNIHHNSTLVHHPHTITCSLYESYNMIDIMVLNIASTVTPKDRPLIPAYVSSHISESTHNHHHSYHIHLHHHHHGLACMSTGRPSQWAPIDHGADRYHTVQWLPNCAAYMPIIITFCDSQWSPIRWWCLAASVWFSISITLMLMLMLSVWVGFTHNLVKEVEDCWKLCFFGWKTRSWLCISNFRMVLCTH